MTITAWGSTAMNAAEHYNSLTQARQSQQRRLGLALGESHWSKWARTYRFNPQREPEPQLNAALRYVESDDELIEIGGGAGRIGLPLALRATSLLNVEPSAAMRAQFSIAVAEHGIANAAVLDAAWPMSESVTADVVLTADVTYFIDDIEPFIRAMDAAARRCVLILTWTVPPTNLNASLFQIAYGEAESPASGFQHLLAVIRELGIAPDTQVIDESFSWPERLPRSEEQAIQFALDELGAPDHSNAAANIEARLDELFERSGIEGDIFTPTWRASAQGMLISWHPAD